MSTAEIAILQRFKIALVQFLDELINWMPEDERLLTTRILVQDQLPMEEVMLKFIEHMLPFADQIAERNEQFFLNDPKVFGQVKDQTQIMSLKKMWTHPEFSNDDKDKAWKWMDFFIRCIRLYQQHHT